MGVFLGFLEYWLYMFDSRVIGYCRVIVVVKVFLEEGRDVGLGINFLGF